MSDYIIQEASAAYRGQYSAQYRKLAVLKVTEGTASARIDKRARNVLEIVKVWPSLYVGKTGKSEFWVAYDEALKIAKELKEGES